MSSFKATLAVLAVLGLMTPALADRPADSARPDPYAGYRTREVVRPAPHRPTQMEHAPRLIRPQPLIRERKTYLNAPPPVETRLRVQTAQPVASVTQPLRGQATVRIDAPTTTYRTTHHYEDIGRARVVRNPLLTSPDPHWQRQIVQPVAPIRHDRYLDDLRYRRGVPRSHVRIESYSGYDCYPFTYRRPIHRPHYRSHVGWRYRHGWHRPYCAPSSGISLYFRF